jgi:hypothetical protein
MRALTADKMENMGTPDTAAQWRDAFYGVSGIGHRPGYYEAEKYWGRSKDDACVPDSMKGWDLCTIVAGGSGGTDERAIRMAVGMALLGNGFVYINKGDPYSERWPWWSTTHYRNIGRPTGEFTKQAFGADTLYCREFTRGSIRVNPKNGVVDGVAARDVEFTYD